MQVKKETIKIGQFKFIVHRANLKRKTARSIQPNKFYFVNQHCSERFLYSHPDIKWLYMG